MKVNPYRDSVESIALQDEDDLLVALGKVTRSRDKWEDRANDLQARLDKILAAHAHEESDVCRLDGCRYPKDHWSRAGLCASHMHDAWQDVQKAWDEGQGFHRIPERQVVVPRKSILPKVVDDLMPTKPWVVYYIRMDKRVKIGRTVDLAMRLKSLYALPDQLLAVEPGALIEGLDRETQRHHEFADLRVPGTELFDVDDRLGDHIAMVRETFGDPLQYL